MTIFALQDAVPVATGYTAGEVLTFFAAGGVLITGLGAVIVNIIVALKTGAKLDAAVADRAALSTKTDTLVAKVEQVHVLTNSNLSAVKAELAAAAAQIHSLRELVTDLKSERNKADVAHALATPAPVRTQDSRTGDAPVVEVLGKIEVNTKEAVEVLKDQKS